MCPGMKGAAAVVSYVVVTVSSVAFVGLPYVLQYTKAFNTIDYNNFNFLEIVLIGCVFGMVLAPYFGAASLIASDGDSVTRETLNLIQKHISFPFLGGIGLFVAGLYLSPAGFPQGNILIPTHLDFVIFYLLTLVASTYLVYEGRSSG